MSVYKRTRTWIEKPAANGKPLRDFTVKKRKKQQLRNSRTEINGDLMLMNPGDGGENIKV